MVTELGRAQRREAGRRLPPEFSRLVIADARALRRGRRERRLMAITGAVCIALAVATHWVMTTATTRENLQQWSATSSEIVAMEENL